MKVDYLSEFGFRLSDYGEYRSGAGRAGGAAKGLRPWRGGGGGGSGAGRGQGRPSASGAGRVPRPGPRL